MEWMLQVADELDDALAALRHYAMGLNGDISLPLAGSVTAGAVWVVLLRIAG
jgi:hypothetical protein